MAIHQKTYHSELLQLGISECNDVHSLTNTEPVCQGLTEFMWIQLFEAQWKVFFSTVEGFLLLHVLCNKRKPSTVLQKFYPHVRCIIDCTEVFI
jgi:hypothetical protein